VAGLFFGRRTGQAWQVEMEKIPLEIFGGLPIFSFVGNWSLEKEVLK